MSGTTFTWDGILQVMFRRNLCCQWQINFIDAQWMNQLWNIVSKLLWAVDRQCQTTTLTIWCLIPAIEEVERWQFGIERELAQYQCPWLGVHVWLCYFLLLFSIFHIVGSISCDLKKKLSFARPKTCLIFFCARYGSCLFEIWHFFGCCVG